MPTLRTRLGGDSPGQVLGFSDDEMAERVAGVLEGMGLRRDFAPLVFVLGHGSSSVNNPHLSAYHCGACGGRRGGPNARLFAEMANTPAVRARLAARGLVIGDDTWFVGGEHDTCSDTIALYDLERVPAALREPLAKATTVLDQACERNAHERVRRFELAPARASPEQARVHVDMRAVDLSEARPEYNHATCAVMIVGRRALSAGLFLDRRAFLVSYDPATDADGALLERVLSAALPVCAGINLEYYFSTVDNERFGAGTKLPHNVTALLGVMDGHASDLRTGLWRQTVEIHEPMRLLCVIEAEPERFDRVLGHAPVVAELVRNEWVQTVLCAPSDGRQWRYTAHGWEAHAPAVISLPVVARSRDWYSGRRDHLAVAAIAGGA
jgi:uncharacterized protein YbcC (UPF0753/DUF2309 family)